MYIYLKNLESSNIALNGCKQELLLKNWKYIAGAGIVVASVNQ